jgi:hypothetical protein
MLSMVDQAHVGCFRGGAMRVHTRALRALPDGERACCERAFGERG